SPGGHRHGGGSASPRPQRATPASGARNHRHPAGGDLRHAARGGRPAATFGAPAHPAPLLGRLAGAAHSESRVEATMRRPLSLITLLTAGVLATTASGGQAPGAASAPDVPVSHRDRVYAAEQFSNTVSVTDPADNKLLGVI